MIKKLKLIGLAVILLQGLGMIHSWVEAWYIRQIWYYWYNPYSQSVDIQITKNGTFLSMTAWNTKKIFVLKDGNNDKSYFIRWYNGVPYYYWYFWIQGSSNNYYWTTQWRLNKYFTCDEIIPDVNENTTNCVEHTIDNNTKIVLGNFLKTVTNDDYFLIDTNTQHAYNSNIWYKNDTLCISSNNAWNSICFYAWAKIWTVGNNSYSKYIDTNNNLQFTANQDRLTINNAYIYNPPSVWSNTTWTNVNNLPYCPTIWQIKQQYEEIYGLTTDVCYAWFNTWDMRWDSSTYWQVQGVSIFDVYEMYSWWMEIQKWYDVYTEYYNNINTNTEQFSGKSKALVWTFMSRQIFGNNQSTYSILWYCQIITSNLDDNATTCTASTWAVNPNNIQPTAEDVIENIIKQPWNTEIVIPWNTTINQSGQVNWNSVYADIIENSDISIRNIIKNLQQMYTKVTWIFEKREGVWWVIPWYLVWLILIIVLFKIFKK